MTTDIVLLYLGGEAFVAGAVRLALKAGMSALTVGLTVVAFGTSSPELLVINDAPCSTPLRLMSSHELLILHRLHGASRSRMHALCEGWRTWV